MRVGDRKERKVIAQGRVVFVINTRPPSQRVMAEMQRACLLGHRVQRRYRPGMLLAMCIAATSAVIGLAWPWLT